MLRPTRPKLVRSTHPQPYRPEKVLFCLETRCWWYVFTSVLDQSRSGVCDQQTIIGGSSDQLASPSIDETTCRWIRLCHPEIVHFRLETMVLALLSLQELNGCMNNSSMKVPVGLIRRTFASLSPVIEWNKKHLGGETFLFPTQKFSMIFIISAIDFIINISGKNWLDCLAQRRFPSNGASGSRRQVPHFSPLVPSMRVNLSYRSFFEIRWPCFCNYWWVHRTISALVIEMKSLLSHTSLSLSRLDQFDMLIQIVFNIEFFKNLIGLLIERTVEVKDLPVSEEMIKHIREIGLAEDPLHRQPLDGPVEHHLMNQFLEFFKISSLVKYRLYSKEMPWTVSSSFLPFHWSCFSRPVKDLPPSPWPISWISKLNLNGWAIPHWYCEEPTTLFRGWLDDLRLSAQHHALATKVLAIERPLFHPPSFIDLPAKYDDVFHLYNEHRCEYCKKTSSEYISMVDLWGSTSETLAPFVLCRTTTTLSSGKDTSRIAHVFHTDQALL